MTELHDKPFSVGEFGFMDLEGSRNIGFVLCTEKEAKVHLKKRCKK